MARDLEKALDSTLDDMINTKRGGGGKGNRNRAKGKGKGKKEKPEGAAAEKPKAVAKKAPKVKNAGEKAVKKSEIGAAKSLDMSLEDIVKSHSRRKEKAPATTSGKDSKAKKLWGGAAKLWGNRRKSGESKGQAKGQAKGQGKKQKKNKGKGKGKDAWDAWGGAAWADPWSSYGKGKGKGKDDSWGGKGKGKNSWGGKGSGKKGDSWKGSGKNDYWEPAPKKDWGSKWEAPKKNWGKGGGKDWEAPRGKGGGKDSWDSAPASSNKRARSEVSWDSAAPAWSAKKDSSKDSWQKKEAERWGQKERSSDSWGAKDKETRGNEWKDSERSDRRKPPARDAREDWGTGQRGQKRAYEEETRPETREGRSSKKIKVTNIPRDLDMYDIRDAFESEAGKIVDCKMARGTALITFTNPKDARKAVDTFDRGELNGKTIEVTFAQ